MLFSNFNEDTKNVKEFNFDNSNFNNFEKNKEVDELGWGNFQKSSPKEKEGLKNIFDDFGKFDLKVKNQTNEINEFNEIDDINEEGETNFPNIYLKTYKTSFLKKF